MSRNLQLVFSAPGADVPPEQFERWYEEHLDEILAIPGFVSAQRFRIEPAVVDALAPAPYRHLVVYETEGDAERLMAAMRARNLDSADAYVERKDVDASGPALPAWWDAVRFASWNCTPLGERVEASA